MGRRNGENNDRRTEQFRKLFIGGLTPQTDEIRLKKYYEQWGELVDFVVMKDNKTGRSRGFGFVTYRDPQMVDEAQNNRPHEIDGKLVEAKRAMPREDSHTPESHMTVNKLFVGGLKKDISKDQLKEYFHKFGSVVDCEIVTWKDSGESRGFGFVTFDDYDPVDKAILYKPHQIASSKVDVKKALSKDEMEEIKRKQTTDSVSMTSSITPAIINTDYYSNGTTIKSPTFLSSMGNYISSNNISASNSTPTPIQPIQSQNYQNQASIPYLGNIMYEQNVAAYQYPGMIWNNGALLSPTYYYGSPNMSIPSTDVAQQYTCPINSSIPPNPSVIPSVINVTNSNLSSPFMYDQLNFTQQNLLTDESDNSDDPEFNRIKSNMTTINNNTSAVNILTGETMVPAQNTSNIAIFQ